VATTNTIALGTSTGHGDWTLTTGTGTLSTGAANSGSASYTYTSADNGAVTLALRDTYPEVVTVSAGDGAASATSGSALKSEDSPITFVPSGFRITNGANAPTTIGTQQSGVTGIQSLALQAVRTDTSTGACTALFASGASVKVGLGYQCNNPTTCIAGQTLALTNNGSTVSLASNPASGVSSYTIVPLKFSTANAEAPFTLAYSDAGQISLAASYNIPLQNGAPSANTMAGSWSFVVQPYTLKLSNIQATSSGTANPGATTASGPVFAGAGQAFSATVTATNLQGNATPNFGRELTPAGVSLNSTLVVPAGGHNPAVSFTAFSGGTATATTLSWPEVGIVTLTPGVANYLNSGAVTGTPSGNVGRFVPNSFATALNVPLFDTGCAAGGFTYLGQPFRYAVAPVVTATALAVGGATTQNYTGALMRISNASLNGRSYVPTPANPSLDLSGLPASAADPAIADIGNGQVTLTFSAGGGLAFARGSPVAPFAAHVSLSENLVDLDGVSAANPVTFNDIAFSAGANQYYGRLTLGNALGSELLDLPVPMQTQYYVNAASGFTPNTADSCTAAPAIGLGNFQLNLKAGQTCVRDSGSPGLSGAGCPAAAASRYGAAAAGRFNLILAAPGAGNTGSVTITATAPAYLQYPWSQSSGANSSPSSMATFGIFQGPPSRIYQREVY
jgi:hypothetical protein